MDRESDLRATSAPLTEAEIAFAIAAGVPRRAFSKKAQRENEAYIRFSEEIIAAEMRAWPTLDDVAARLDVEPIAVRQLVAAKELMSATVDGFTVIPPWQLTADGALLPGVKTIVATLAGGDPFVVHRLMTLPADELDNRSPKEALEQGEAIAPVVELVDWLYAGS